MSEYLGQIKCDENFRTLHGVIGEEATKTLIKFSTVAARCLNQNPCRAPGKICRARQLPNLIEKLVLYVDLASRHCRT